MTKAEAQDNPTAAPAQPRALDLKLETARGDVRDFLLSRLKDWKKPWAKMSEREQRDEAASCSLHAVDLLRELTTLFSGHEFPTVEVQVGKLGLKDNIITSEIRAARSDPNLLAIANAQASGPLVLVLASAQDYMGQRAPAAIMKDQPDLMDGAAAEGEAAPLGDVVGDVVKAAEAQGHKIDPETGEVLHPGAIIPPRAPRARRGKVAEVADQPAA